MEYKKAIETYRRMCDSHKNDFCQQCEMSHSRNPEGVRCVDLLYQNPDIAEEILEKWDKEHPKKTILTEFLEYYPNALIGDDGTPTGVCPSSLGYADLEDCGDNYKDVCVQCWNRTPEEAKPANES